MGRYRTHLCGLHRQQHWQGAAGDPLSALATMALYICGSVDQGSHNPTQLAQVALRKHLPGTPTTPVLKHIKTASYPFAAERGDGLAAALQPGHQHPAPVLPQPAMAGRAGRGPWRRAAYDRRLCARACLPGAAGVRRGPCLARRVLPRLAEGTHALASKVL